MQEEDVPPGPQLMESMRAVGYTLESAIADLVDNSISAKATSVHIHFGSLSDDFVSILDNGEGMSSVEARKAMKLAPSSPRALRTKQDLGRFGLGLKTASLSQCREITLVSKKNDEVVGVRWSLDFLAETGRWSLIILDETELSDLPDVHLLAQIPSGTLILWRQLDQFSEALGGVERALDEHMVRVRAHLELVFHRFVGGENGTKLSLSINGVQLRHIDPFLSAHPATQVGPLESFVVDGKSIQLRPYTLPLLNKLSSTDRDRALIAGSFRDSQGFYIYRAMRLVIWGTWFRIAPKDDLGKLARVRVDIPNTLDHLWALDIKKSAAVPPPIIRNELRRVASRIVAPSRSAHLYRGRPETSVDGTTRTWNLVRDRDSFRYEVNREHPAVASLTKGLDPATMRLFEGLLDLLEESFPVEDVYNRLGQDQQHIQSLPAQVALEELAAAIWRVNRDDGMSAEDFIDRLAFVEPFSRLNDAANMLKKVTEQSDQS
jgi:hypothetical protein